MVIKNKWVIFLCTVTINLIADEALTPMHVAKEATMATPHRAEKMETVVNERGEVEQVPLEQVTRSYDLNKIDFGPREKNGLTTDTIRPQKLKNRVYIRYNTTLMPNRWVADLTDENGFFTSPDRYLVPGAVIPGEWLGAPGSKYKLLDTQPPTIKAWQASTENINPNFSTLVGRTETNEPIRQEGQYFPPRPRPR